MNSWQFFPLVYLTGTGSQLLLFDIDRGQQIKSFRIFEGVRVHGIAAQVMKHEGDSLSCSVTFKIIVSGERRVKLYSLRLQLEPMFLEPPCVSTDLILLQLLPRFTHWVLDICFLWVILVVCALLSFNFIFYDPPEKKLS